MKVKVETKKTTDAVAILDRMAADSPELRRLAEEARINDDSLGGEQGLERGGDHAADALDGVGPERAAAVLQGVAEGGILTPAVKRAAFDLQLPRHLPSRPADGKQFDGRPLPLAQIGRVGRGTSHKHPNRSAGPNLNY